MSRAVPVNAGSKVRLRAHLDSISDEKWVEIITRFHSRYTISESGCWEMDGYLYRGYSKIKVNGVLLSGHKFAYLYLVGDVEDGLQLDHLCRNPKCANPYHLEPVTPQENLARSLMPQINSQKARARTTCYQGHEYTPENTRLREHGWRICKICEKDIAARFRRRRGIKPRVRQQMRDKLGKSL